MNCKKTTLVAIKIFPLFIFAFLFMLLSCEKKTAVKTTKNETKVLEEKSPQNPPVYLDSLATENQILSHFEQRKKDLIFLLQEIEPEKANVLYEKYIKENDSSIILLEQKKSQLLEKFTEYGDYNSETDHTTMSFPKGVEKTVNLYKENGIEFWDVGEGMTVLRMFPNYYADIFKGKLTKDFDRYVNLTSKEEKELFVSDASLSVPWSEAAKRVKDREKFLLDFPDSSFKDRINEELIGYQYAFLLGYDNTQTNEQGVFNEENVVEFKKFMKNNPNSETTKIIQEMLSKKWTRDELHDFVRSKLGKDQF